ncbi:MAG: DNA methyltransferase [Melioribacteraceae bacterium]
MNYYPISIKEIKAKVAKKKYFKQPDPQIAFEDLSNVKNITNEFGESLIRIDGEIPKDLEIENGQRFLFISYDQTKYSHGIHKYPAKFFPELPRWLIKKYSNPYDLILDPFAGSATTNIEALLSNRNSIAIDVDPFARYLAKVKTTPINNQELDYAVDYILKELVNYTPFLVDKTDIPDFPYRENWFINEILLELAFIKKTILKTATNQDIKDLCLISMSSVIRAVSNADDNCTRTVVRKKLNKEVFPSFALTKFAENLILNSFRIKDFTNRYQFDNYVEIPTGNDARFLTYPDNSIDLAITSPPYANAVDYPRTHQLEMYWLGLANGSLSKLKEIHIGTEVVKINDYKNLHLIGEDQADQKIKAIFNSDPRRAFIAYKYLYDMSLNMKEVYRKLKPGARYIVVVGNNRIKGELFESWKYLMNLSKGLGFNIENYFGSEIIKHFIKVPREERINTDWIIVLRK